MLTIGVISDTHVPDRLRELDTQVISIFRAAQVAAIMHAGDVSGPDLLAQLEEVAPVYAVRGNRDWVRLRHLPDELSLTFDGVNICMAHGHGGWVKYLLDKPYFYRYGYHPERLLPRLQARFPEAQVIIFGHGHTSHNRRENGQLLFNPGSPHLPDRAHHTRSIGLLHIPAAGVVQGEIVELGQSAASATSA
jgi:putative phosphoesterase